jgi:hypothetical protein
MTAPEPWLSLSVGCRLLSTLCNLLAACDTETAKARRNYRVQLMASIAGGQRTTVRRLLVKWAVEMGGTVIWIYEEAVRVAVSAAERATDVSELRRPPFKRASPTVSLTGASWSVSIRRACLRHALRCSDKPIGAD